MSEIGTVPQTVKAVVLFKQGAREELIACEAVTFAGGAPAIDTVLRRARISGHVRVGGELRNFFADLLDADGSMVENVALDRNSYRALKTRWTRTKIDRGDTDSR